MRKLFLLCLVAGCFYMPTSFGQNESTEDADTSDSKTLLEKTSFSGLKFRNVGPAVTSGRISDFAVDPLQPKNYYVATSSGGVWKTINAGTTFEPIFDSQGSYSIGCVTMDPKNSNVIWVGTGENNNQRSVAYGDGIYKSADGGSSWKKMGLAESQHIGSIIVHPDSSDVIYVAAIGPVWSKGGDRGVYKSTDGGVTWNAVLTIDEHTGVNDIVMDPKDPKVIYASAFQRRRHVFTYLGGGPGSAIYKTVDGGRSWNKVVKGLPSVDLGRIGLTISPADPGKIYAIVEAAEDKGGFYVSTNHGASWNKQGSYSTSGNYYQEIVADPKDPNKIFAMDTWMHYSVDGGKSFEQVGEVTKHVDNHCMWIDPTDTDHFLVGCDGGIYETWDHASTWHFKGNLPVTQFYKVAVDNHEPFYHIYGGTQDNFSLGGPSRSNKENGISNDQWFVTQGGDGFESQVDPENPDIIYAQAQYGVLVRYDKKSGETLGIKPKPAENENDFRWNWDAPLQVSKHVPQRLYFAANKVFQSDNRGHSWKEISGDLTRQINRNELKVMDRVWGIDAVSKNLSTSPYGTIVALSESPLQQDLLYIGTDDGLIQVTENGGDEWAEIEVSGAPEQSYVNAVLASKHDENVVYAAFNHHKYGDFKPYIFRSNDKGKSWTAIASNLPDRGSVYSLEEDFVDPNLLFAGTEFGIFFSSDGGNIWKELSAGMPTIAVRDIAIQERENDLVLGTFGRSFFVLDDYSSLRHLKEEDLNDDYELLSIRDARSWEWSYPLGLPGKSFQGDSYYQGENLGPVAMITYYLKEGMETLEKERQEAEKKLRKDNGDVSYPSYEALKAEEEEEEPLIYFVIQDDQGNLVRKLTRSPAKGVQRIQWDLRYAPKDPVSLSGPSRYNPFAGIDEGPQVPAGTYSVTMYSWHDGEMKQLDDPVSFQVTPLDHNTLPAENPASLVAFKNDVAALSGRVSGSGRVISDLRQELKYIRKSILSTETSELDFLSRVVDIEAELRDISTKFYGDRIASRLDIDKPMSIRSRLSGVEYESKYSSSAPTQTHLDSYTIASKQYEALLLELNTLIKDKMEPLRKDLQAVGAPYTPNMLPYEH